jgi:hypothetical protein
MIAWLLGTNQEEGRAGPWIGPLGGVTIQAMLKRTSLLSVIFGAALVGTPGCAPEDEPPPTATQQEPLTPERAKTALLAMMRTKPAKDLGWFEGNVVDEMSKMEIEKQEDGWYRWTGAYTFHPSKALYHFAVLPAPGARACIFEYNGTFIRKDGKWVATPPTLISTALQVGN